MAKQGSNVTVSKHALIVLSIGPYYGEVLFDVPPMDTCRLLGRPWLFDNRVIMMGTPIRIHSNTRVVILL